MNNYFNFVHNEMIMKIQHLEDIQVYAQVVDSGSLASAGRVLNLSSTLVSRRIARLEKSLGVRLLERTTRSLCVTDEGQVFYRRCRRILAELEDAEQDLVPASTRVSGIVRALLPTSMLAYGVMTSLKALLKQHPNLTVQIQLADSQVDLMAGGWDVATHIGAPKDSSHIGRRLGVIEPRLAATAEYLNLAGKPQTPMDLTQHQCIRMSVSQTQTHWTVIDDQGISQDVPIGGQLICHDVISLVTAMKSGLGIGLIPRASLMLALEKGELLEVLPDCHIEANPLYALIPSGRNQLPRIKVFVDWLAQFIQSLNNE